ncbi:MAG TPA: Ig-like domain-containing protein, partial [Verrucomicrobiae bacterium]|nr:Ig-like domain-containing protein [Verrucomicrobiae bacterium]
MSFFVSIRVRAVTNDFYTTLAGTLLSVPAPGVLTNDGTGSLSAILTAAPANGTAFLNTNGSFTYTPATNFNGMDGFAYVVTNAVKGTSAVAAADIMVSSRGEAFYDNFWRPTNSGPIFPYTQVSDKKFVQGTWGISNGLMNGSSPADTYGYLYYENSKWSNYSVQAQVQFSSISAASAGIFGRLNPTNGAHYAVWIYPEDSTEQYSPEN